MLDFVAGSCSYRDLRRRILARSPSLLLSFMWDVSNHDDVTERARRLANIGGSHTNGRIRSSNRAPAAARRVRRASRTSSRRTARCRPARRSTRCVDYDAIPDTVDGLIGTAGLRRHDDQRRRVLAAVEHQPRAPALAVPHGPQRSSAAGEDDAVLAQPLRHRLQQDCRRARRDRRRAVSGGQGVRGSRPGARPDRDAARQRARQLQGHPARDREGHGDAGLARRPDEHQGASRRRTSAARSWSCSRSASATTPSRTCMPRARVFTGWNLQRPGAAADGIAALRVRLQRRPARDDRQDVQLSRSIRTAARRSRRARRRTACRTASTSSTASPRTRTRRAIWRRSCIASSSTSSARSTSRSSTASPRSTCRTSGDMKAVMREVLLSPRVLGRRRLLRALLVAGRSSSSARSRTSAGPASRSTTR